MESVMKVYGYTGYVRQFDKQIPGHQARIVVAARSLADARRIIETSDYVGWPGRDFISTTVDKEELALALADPGTIFARALDESEWITGLGRPHEKVTR